MEVGVSTLSVIVYASSEITILILLRCIYGGASGE